MRRNLRFAERLGRVAPLLAAAALAFGASQATATPPSDASPLAARSRPERWKGRHCPPSGCAGGSGSPWSAAVGFGTAIVASGWIARRQR